MPRILNRPPYHSKPKIQGSSFLSSTTSKGSAFTTSSGPSRSERSHVLSGGGDLHSSFRSVQTTRSSNHSQVTYDASISNASYDGESGRLQNNDWGHFVDFYDPECRDDEIVSSFLLRH